MIIPLWFAAACGSVSPVDAPDAASTPDAPAAPDAAAEPDATPAPDAASDACVQTTCAAAGAACGVIADGCGGTVTCDPCGAGQVCGATADHACAPTPTLKLRNGFVQSDGAKAHSQTCDVAASGVLDCTTTTHPFAAFALPPSGLTLPAGARIADRTIVVYRTPTGARRLLTAYLQADGAREYVQSCAMPATGPLTCDPATSPYVAVALPPAGVTLAPGTHVGGRFGYAFVADGRIKVRQGYVQSDGTRSVSQDCDVAADGALVCDPATHPFQVVALPPSGVTPAAGTVIRDRYTYAFYADGVPKLRSGYVQSDGAQSWSQNCDVAPSGALDCDPVTHPFAAFAQPGTGLVPDAGTVLDHRYAFTYVE
ncbi:MAG: hypothetical protein JNK64_00695 [Myxococcales bacterium]|nr:hypothetical protein [Myxococcales bacterium]